MKDPLSKFLRETWPDSPSATSSPESAAGPTPSAKPDGPMTDLFGQEVAHASPSHPPAKAMSSQMSATYGRLGSGSRASLDLTQSLASRFQAKTRSLGSTMFELTWKARVTPSGFSIPALRASGRRISASACTSRPTPAVHDTKALMDAAQLVSPWATPMVNDAKGPQHAPNKEGGQDLSSQAAWVSPQAADANGAGANQHTASLDNQVRLTDSGQTPNGSPAATEKRGQLNPGLSRWLQGLPPEWCDCAVTAMQSMPSKRATSSKRILKSTAEDKD